MKFSNLSQFQHAFKHCPCPLARSSIPLSASLLLYSSFELGLDRFRKLFNVTLHPCRSRSLKMDKSSAMNRNENKQLLPMSVLQSVGFFGIPSLLFAVSVYIFLPALDRAGAPLFLNFLISLRGPLGLLLIASLVASDGRNCHGDGARSEIAFA